MTYKVENKNSNLMDMFGRNATGCNAMKNITNISSDCLMLCQAFKTAGESFQVIERNSAGVLVPYGEGKEIINKLASSFRPEELPGLLKKAQRFTVNVRQRQLQKLSNAKALVRLARLGILVLKDSFYNENIWRKRDQQSE